MILRRSLVLTLVCLVGVPATASAAPPEKTPLRIDSIIPSTAARGELVTVVGAGLGAANLAVTIGGDAVALVAATGTRASFRVPGLARPGRVAVTAQNPGGHERTIALNVAFDGRTAAVTDAAAAKTVAVGA